MNLLPAAYKLPEPIRPRRCPAPCYGSGTVAPEFPCGVCGGAGFLYPDPPDDWPDLTGYRVSSKWPHIPWRTYCEITWQMVLGVGDTDA